MATPPASATPKERPPADDGFTLRRLARIKLIYAVAFSLIALTLLASSAVMRYAIDKSAGDARVINLSGRQRMLSQRITKCVLAIAQAGGARPADPRAAELAQALKDWVRAHQGLQFGDAGLGLPSRAKSAGITHPLLSGISGWWYYGSWSWKP